MTSLESNPSPSVARLAGFLYLIIIVCGIAGEAFVRTPLVVVGDAARTAANIAAGAATFRFSILLDVVMALSDVALAVLLYLFFEPVSRALSLAAMAFRLVQAAVLGLNLLNLYQAAVLATATAPGPMRAELVALFVDGHKAGYDFGLFFFGINCLLVGALLRRGGFRPRALGALMGAAGVVYLVGSTLRVVAPGAADAFSPAYLIPLVAELSFCIALLAKRVDGTAPPRADAPQAA